MTISLAKIEIGLADMRSRYQQAKGQLELLTKQQQEKTKDWEDARIDIETWQQVQVLLGKVSEFARQQLKLMIEETVTAALQAVFATNDISFEIELTTISNKPAANWQVISRFGEAIIAGEPETTRGGGVSDIVSLALRLALLELARPKMDGAVFLDEIGKHVSKEFVPNVAEFLKQYAAQTGRQVILITHQQALADIADLSYSVSQENGESVVSVNG